MRAAQWAAWKSSGKNKNKKNKLREGHLGHYHEEKLRREASEKRKRAETNAALRAAQRSRELRNQQVRRHLAGTKIRQREGESARAQRLARKQKQKAATGSSLEHPRRAQCTQLHRNP